MKIKFIILNSIAMALIVMSYTAYVNCQGAEDELVEVTIQMFTALQVEVQDLYAQIGNLQTQLDTLAENIQNLATGTAVIGSAELADIQSLIDASNRQDGDITKLVNTNGMWQQNFRVINNTFERLRKVVVFPIPVLNNAPPVPTTIRKSLPSTKPRTNIIILQRRQRINTTNLQRQQRMKNATLQRQQQQRMNNVISLQKQQIRN